MKYIIDDLEFFSDGKIYPLSNDALERLLINGVSIDDIIDTEMYAPGKIDIKLNIPEFYKKINMQEYFNSYRSRNRKINERIDTELSLMLKYNLEDLFRQVIYILDYLKFNNIVYGVGRGSSCASYLLFLLGLHKVDCIKYDISPTEFFKD